MFHNTDPQTLRAVLVELAVADMSETDLPSEEAGIVAEMFRDLRLELIRLGEVQFSADQWHRLRQIEYRLEMVATRRAVPSSIAAEAERALTAFGWTPRI